MSLPITQGPQLMEEMNGQGNNEVHSCGSFDKFVS